MNGGVLIIGSLLWDPARESWRNRLRLADGVLVSVPIRYGRISPKRRHDTYTMVLSSECKATPGTGYVIPFANSINDIDNLHDEVVELLSAEKDERHTHFRYNIGFCVAALAINPRYQANRNELTIHWNSRIGERFQPDDYRVGNEAPIVSKSGILQMEWPAGIDHFDFIVATATKPTPPSYPVPKDIAEKMNEKKYWDYFLRNRAHGITTHEDAEITKYLSPTAHSE